MLRAAGEKDRKALQRFLDEHAAIMPSVILRAALEHFDAKQKAHFLA